MRRIIPILAALIALAAPAAAMADGGAKQFIPSAHENGDGTVTLPLHRGTSGGHDVWFVVLDASTSNGAAAFGANRSNKLANARGTAAFASLFERLAPKAAAPLLVEASKIGRAHV